MIEQWDDLSDYRRQEAIAPAAEALGIRPEDAVRLVSDALVKARHTALESASDADIPEQMRVLALITEAVTSQHITAIKRGPAERDVTPYPQGWEAADRIDYHLRRLSRRLLPGDPERRTQSFTAYYFIVNGNPIIIEGYLKQSGYPGALADSPVRCRVCEV